MLTSRLSNMPTPKPKRPRAEYDNAIECAIKDIQDGSVSSVAAAAKKRRFRH
jgi:hypothetical protein